MRKEREVLLVAALAGLVIVSAAAFFVQPNLGGRMATRLQYGNAPLVQQGAAIAPRWIG